MKRIKCKHNGEIVSVHPHLQLWKCRTD